MQSLSHSVVKIAYPMCSRLVRSGRVEVGNTQRLFTTTTNVRSHQHMVNTLQTTLDWSDRIGLQSRLSLDEKGWHVGVDWRPTPYGAGVFATQDIAKGSVLRTGVIGVNLKEFCSLRDIDDFCHQGKTPEEISARREYVKDYLWGFNKNADERGYDQDAVEPERFFGMWIPGNGLNHSVEPNTVYRATPDGINLVALCDISKDDELVDDYRRHGLSPNWLKEFALIHNVTLNFGDCNDFVQ